MSKFKDYESDSAESLRMRDTAGQDRHLAQPSALRRHRRLIIAGVLGAAAVVALVVWLMRFSGINSSVDRSRLTIAKVERGVVRARCSRRWSGGGGLEPHAVCDRGWNHLVARPCG